MDNTLIIVKKEMKSIFNEKTLILAIIVQLLIASFSSMLVLGLASFFDPSALDKYDVQRANVGIVGDGELEQFIERSQVKPYYYKDLESAISDFKNNRIDAVLVVPPIESGGTDIIELVLYLPKSDIRGTLVTLQLKKPLEEFEAFVRGERSPRIGFEPIRLHIDGAPKKISIYFEFIYGILIPLLVFTPVFISGGLIIDTITEEYERKTLELLLVSPISFSEILNGKMLTSIIIVPLQGFLWLMLISLNRIAVYNIWIILLLMTIIAVIFVHIGAIVAVKYRERAISQYIYSLILILLFLLGTLFANSPFNLMTRLSSGAIGTDALVYCGLYAATTLPFYFYAKKIQNS